MFKNLIKKITPSFLIKAYHFFFSFSGAIFYGFPSEKMKVIGITGTNGKTTTVDLISRILEEAGYKVAAVSSVKFKIADKEWQNDLKMTMPGRFILQRFLRKALKSNCQYVVLEVTSEGIAQFRHRFIDFDVAIFTNLSLEHIERHGSFENYRQAKGELFKKCREIHIINLDDPNAKYFLKFPANEKYVYGLNESLKIEELEAGNWKLIKAVGSKCSENGIEFKVNDVCFSLKLLGEFNIYNSLVAICAGLSQGVNLETCQKALGKAGIVPGRMEVVVEKPFKVIVDYAHTPDSLQKVYETLSGISNSQFPISNSKKPKLICVLGSAGGGRDKWKRPEMGKIASQNCEEIILTNEDPYDENPMEIIEQVAKGVENISINQSNQHKSAVHKILDRRKAVKKALGLANPGDIVIITGKGCEPWMCLENNRKIPWDDRDVVREEFKKTEESL